MSLEGTPIRRAFGPGRVRSSHHPLSHVPLVCACACALSFSTSLRGTGGTGSRKCGPCPLLARSLPDYRCGSRPFFHAPCLGREHFFKFERTRAANLGQLGSTRGQFSPTWGQGGPTWANLGAIWANLGPTSANLGPTWDQLGTNIGMASRIRIRGRCILHVFD